MSTWQVFSDANNNFRWQCSHINLTREPQKVPIDKPSSPHHLPSIADVLVQGYSKLDNNQTGGIKTPPPTFQTGLGNPVAVKQSSLGKASSIIGDQDDGATVISKSGFSKLCENQNDGIETAPAFRTGLGRPVVVKQSSLLKASSILGDQENSRTGYSKLYETETPLMFQTGLGKPVVLTQASIAKASSILGDQDYTECLKVIKHKDDQAKTSLTFQTGSGNLVVTRKSSLEKALSILGDQDDDAFSDRAGGSAGRDDGTSCLSSMFQTGSGKTVSICSKDLIKARTLLGLEENSDHDEASKGLEQSRKHANAGEIEDVARGSVRSVSRPPPIKFHTAGGRSVKVSSDALKRARHLLGDPDLGNFLKDGDAGYPVCSSRKNGSSRDYMLNKENNACTFFSDDIPKAKQMSKSFISPARSALSDQKNAVRLEHIDVRSNLIKEFDATEQDITIKQSEDTPCSLAPSTENTPHAVEGVRWALVNNGCTSGVRKPMNGPLVDISNTFVLNSTDHEQVTGEKRKLSSRKYTSPFKKPRNSKFIPPLNKKSAVVPKGSTMAIKSEGSCCKRSVSTRYPFLFSRKYVKEYFEEPPSFQNMFGNLPEWLRKINSENADKHMLEDGSGLKRIGVDFFFQKLAQSGCSTVSKKWIANHYKWIVWKLACYERCYPSKFFGKLLTASNVMEELKYRYEREINNGHRSALKRILEGDAPPSSPLILCIASIQYCKAEPDTEALPTSNAIKSSIVTSIELTDGWYSVKGLLDELLLKQLIGGKLFVGQKLRICGAGLCGWNAPVSPLEASTMISLCLHINGTYRAHWADRLGFCKSGCAPLAFKCIKGSGGVVPITLVGVTRIYPTLYRERLSDGGFVIRSERMESKKVQLYDHRRSSIVEGVMSEFQRGVKSFQIDEEQNTGDEGEKISRLLEKAAEPEVIIAEMSSEQLSSFTTYQEKIEATRQSEMQKSIEIALMEAGLSRREVNTFMRVRVIGLTSRSCIQKSSPQQGLITIWNPTEKQQSVLVEGQAYAVSGLIPINSDTDTIYLRSSGSAAKWQSLSMSTTEQFQTFFHPRKPVSLSKMGEVPLSSEFDVAAFVIYVGEVHKSAHQKKQWVFVADGSISLSHPQELSDALLAISFCSPSVDCDSIIPINYNLVGSTVGFCNLIKCAKDQVNHIWVAEATENSTYFLSYDGANSKHLKDAATSANRWAKASSLMVEKLKAKISSIVAKK